MKKIVFSVIGIALVSLLVVAGGRQFCYWQFGEEVINFSRKTSRECAYAAYHLAEPHFTDDKAKAYRERLKKLEWEYQHPYQNAVKNATDPEFSIFKGDTFGNLAHVMCCEFRNGESPWLEMNQLTELASDAQWLSSDYELEKSGIKPSSDKPLVTRQEYLDDIEKLASLKQRAHSVLSELDTSPL